MKRILLSLAAFLLTIGMATAQNGKTFRLDVKKTGTAVVEKRGGLKDLKKDGVKKNRQKITLADNQKLMGPYITDDVATSEEGLGLPRYPGQLGAAAYLNAADYTRFNGGNIVQMRYGLANATTVNSVFISYVRKDGSIVEAFNEKVTGTSVAGWNTVTLSQPYTLDLTGVAGVLMGFYYTQSNANNGQSYYDECFPLSITGGAATSTFIYGNLGEGQGWYNLGTESYGSLSVQAVVEKDFPDYDLSLSNLIPYAFNKAGEKEAFSFAISSYGKYIPQSYTIDVTVDGKQLGSYDTPVALTEDAASLSGSVVLPSDLAVGSHTLTVAVAKINGEAPTENTADDVVTGVFNIYTQTLPRQKQLVEHFTSTSCTYCPNGDQILVALAGKRDDIARVSVHGIQNYNYPDPMYIEDCDVIMENEVLGGFPSASYNRAVFDFGTGEGLTLTQSLGYNPSYKDQLAVMLSEAIDNINLEYPSFATVKVAADYNPEDGKLTVKVNGDVVDDFTTLMGGDATLNVCLIEDGIVSRQLNNGTWVSSYTHNSVLRKYVSGVNGDAINLSGNSYENDYVIDFNSEWKAENMRVVAFVSRPLSSPSLFDMFVTNTEMAALTIGGNSGIAKIGTSAGEIYEVARYNVNGSQIAAPQKGINVVKMSNGEVRKVLVR
ncbi:MAG: Omp28-related outer membrane protein [Prevotella sp.]|nr:Omp28-related outer membrane protein [Prevotella sp.]MDO4933260.1 Omp28-related outer membrane protein [Prevotella sp.]